MAQAFVQMLERAYDALLHFGINYRSLPEYLDHRLLDEASALVVTQGRDKYLLWMERLSNAIDAAVRRKQWRILDGTPPPATTH